jgi:hypothetical protein
MSMKKVAVIAVAVLSFALTWAPNASAVQISGGFSIANTDVSGFEWLCPGPGDTGVNCPVATATLIDFQAEAAVKSPGIPGVFVVNSASGDFLPLDGADGLIKDFNFGTSFVSPGNFPQAPIVGFEIAALGIVTVDLLEVTGFTTTCASGCTNSNGAGNPNSNLTIEGKVLFHVQGFDPTPGFFSFQGGQGSGNFSFAAQHSAVPSVPEPTSVLLLGLGLTGLVVGRRLKK